MIKTLRIIRDLACTVAPGSGSINDSGVFLPRIHQPGVDQSCIPIRLDQAVSQWACGPEVLLALGCFAPWVQTPLL